MFYLSVDYILLFIEPFVIEVFKSIYLSMHICSFTQIRDIYNSHLINRQASSVVSDHHTLDAKKPSKHGKVIDGIYRKYAIKIVALHV